MKRVPLKQLLSDQSGSVLLLVGLSLTFLFAAAGMGYDLGRLELVNEKMQQASDAAALAAASLPSGATTTDRQNEGLRYFALNYPATYLGVPRPAVTVKPTSSNVTVTVANQKFTTNFVTNVGIATTTTKGSSNVNLSASVSSDYDVVMVVDESGSEGTLLPPSYTGTREQAQQAALTTMANTIVPADTTNPNVRMGFIGFSGYISNKWGLSNRNADAMTAISNMRPLDQNFDHVALLTARNMLLGGQGAANGQITSGNGTVAVNTTTPNPRTLRTSNNDANGIAPTKYVIFLSDGGIMIEPDDDRSYYPELLYDLSGLVHKDCPGRTFSDTECFAAFTDACHQLRNTGSTENVHVFIINLNNPVTPGELSTLTDCASASVAGAPAYSATIKPNPTRDFYFAEDSATLQNLLKNITTTIQKERITQ